MPFTAAHPAAVLPLLRRGRWVSAALVSGSVAPDMPSFLPLIVRRQHAHYLHAVLWPDSVIGLGVLLIWWVLLRPGLTPLWPQAMSRLGRPGWRDLLGRAAAPDRPPKAAVAVEAGWVVLSVVVGVATHLLWDAFTHVDGYFVIDWPVLTHRVLGHPWYVWFQDVCSVLGVIVVLAYLVHRWRVAAPAPVPARASDREAEGTLSLSGRARWLVVVAVIGVTVASGAVEYAARTGHTKPVLVWSAAIKAASGGLILALGAWSLAWTALQRRRARNGPHTSVPARVP